MAIRCEIVSQDKMVFEGDADIVIVPGESGEMGILPNHAPLLSTLKMGIIQVRSKDKEEDRLIMNHYSILPAGKLCLLSA